MVCIRTSNHEGVFPSCSWPTNCYKSFNCAPYRGRSEWKYNWTKEWHLYFKDQLTEDCPKALLISFGIVKRMQIRMFLMYKCRPIGTIVQANHNKNLSISNVNNPGIPFIP